MCLFGDIRFSVWKKSQNSVKFRGISRNYTTRNSAEFRRNFIQFRTEYGIDGSKKNRRNSVSTEFRGHPTCSSTKGCTLYCTCSIAWHGMWHKRNSPIHDVRTDVLRKLQIFPSPWTFPSFSVRFLLAIVAKEVFKCRLWRSSLEKLQQRAC